MDNPKPELEEEEQDGPEYCLMITQVSNGYILEYIYENGLKDRDVYECPDLFGERGDDPAPLFKARDLLWKIASFFSLTGSKHDKYRLRISVIDQETGEEVDE